MKVGKPQRIGAGGHSGAIFDRALVDALARGEEAAAQIGDRSDLELTQILGARRKGKMNGFEHCLYSAASAAGRSHSTVARRM